MAVQRLEVHKADLCTELELERSIARTEALAQQQRHQARLDEQQAQQQERLDEIRRQQQERLEQLQQQQERQAQALATPRSTGLAAATAGLPDSYLPADMHGSLSLLAGEMAEWRHRCLQLQGQLDTAAAQLLLPQGQGQGVLRGSGGAGGGGGEEEQGEVWEARSRLARLLVLVTHAQQVVARGQAGTVGGGHGHALGLLNG